MKTTTLHDIIQASSERMKDVTVHVQSHYGWVTISAPGEADIFLQDEDGYIFYSEAVQLYNKVQTVSMDACYALLAEPYAENFWGYSSN